MTNRQREYWRRKQEEQHCDSVETETTEVTTNVTESNDIDEVNNNDKSSK